MNLSNHRNTSIAAPLVALAISGCSQESPQAPTAASSPKPLAAAPEKQIQAKPASQQKLEEILRCATSPSPIGIVKALQAEKIIPVELAYGMDSISYFPTLQPLEVWGLKVVFIHGFDFDQKVFWRGPGTPPRVTIGVVVPYPEEEVKQKLKLEGISAATVQDSILDFLAKGKIKPPLTEITCEEPQ